MKARRHAGTTARSALAATAASVAMITSSADAQDDKFVLVLEDLATMKVRLAEVTRTELIHLDDTDRWTQVDLDRCVAVFDPAGAEPPQAAGMLELVDGQRLPGTAIKHPPHADVLSWNHPWLGRLDIDLARVASIRLIEDAPEVVPRDEDVVVLANGDRQEGLIVAFGDPISLEVTTDDGVDVVQVPLERTAAVAMVNPRRAPTGRRVWFRQGTVIDVKSIRLQSDGYMRLTTGWLPAEMQPVRVRIGKIAAVLFDSDAMIPLAAIDRWRVEGPGTRYIIPPPARLDPDAPLGLSRISVHGPSSVRYLLPDGVRRFAARAALPVESQRWGDYEFIVRDDDRVVFRQRLNAEVPSVEVNVELRGTELTLELTEGRYGPIQDVLILERAMVSTGF